MSLNTVPLRRNLLLACLFLGLIVQSCAGGKKSEKDPVSSGGSSSKSGGESSADQKDEQTTISGERRMLVQSMSNNGFTSKTVSRSKATELSIELGESRSKDINTNYGAIVANRLAGKPVSESLAPAQRILDQSIGRNPDADLPEIVQLELALSALQTSKYGLAEFYLQKLTKSKNVKIRASAINALGVVAIRVDRIPEAVATFREALAADNDYEPAKLNIAFLALQGGDAATAKQMLGAYQDDWFVDSGLIGVERLSGDAAKADQRCDRVLSKHPKHKPTLINCAINAYQGQNDFKKARELLGKAMQVPGGPSAWDEKSGRLLGMVDAEEARLSQARAIREAEERKAKADQAKAASDASAAKPAAQPGPQK